MASFNSRSPSGLRPNNGETVGDYIGVSIHAAQAGCDGMDVDVPSQPSVSIHAAQAGCDENDPTSLRIGDVSIHAAQAGCDPLELLPPLKACFVSIHAAQAGCDKEEEKEDDTEQVSIHAAQAGCDGCCKDTTKKIFSQRINRESPYQ